MFDINRIDRSIRSGTIQFPKGLSHEQRHAYVKKELERLDKKAKVTEETAQVLWACWFFTYMTVTWLLHIATGWFRWLFFAKKWNGKAADIEVWAETYDSYDSEYVVNMIKNHTTPDADVSIVVRTHPFMFSNPIIYVKTKYHHYRVCEGNTKRL